MGLPEGANMKPLRGFFNLSEAFAFFLIVTRNSQRKIRPRGKGLNYFYFPVWRVKERMDFPFCVPFGGCTILRKGGRLR